MARIIETIVWWVLAIWCALAGWRLLTAISRS